MDGLASAFLADAPLFASFPESSGSGILYVEDFDVPAEPPAGSADAHAAEAPPPAPLFTAAELEAAREAGRQEGQKQGYAASVADTLAVQAEIQAAGVQALADAVLSSRARLEDIACQAAEETAKTILAMLLAALPATMARHGACELEAVLRAILPGLRCAPELRARAHPSMADHVRDTLMAQLPPEMNQVSVAADTTLAPGDVLVAWTDGRAIRDGAAIWTTIRTALAPLDLPPIEEICRGRS